MYLSPQTGIHIDDTNATAVGYAAKALAKDLSDIFSSDPVVTDKKEADQIRIGVSSRGVDETFTIDVRDEDNSITVTGSDDLGAVFGVYYVCETYLGVDPYRFWTDSPAKPQRRIEVPEGRYEHQPPAMRFRGWFTNGEDCLVGWHDDMRVGMDTWAAVFETMLRAGFNMVLPGTGIDAESPQVQLASDMGLWITQHHAEPMGAPMFSRVYPDIPPRYPEDMDKFEALYRQAIAANQGRKVVWALGFRGQGDHAFYSEDPRYRDKPEEQGRVIGDVIRFQKSLIEQAYPGRNYFLHNLYGESAHLYRAGHLKLDEDVIRVWGDNGFGAMRVRRKGIGCGEPHTSSLPTKEDRGKPFGVYYHVNFHDLEISNQVVPLVAPELIVHEFDALYEAGGDRLDCLVLNVGNIRPHLVDISLIGRIVNRPSVTEPLGVEFAERHYRDYSQTYFPRAAEDAAKLLKNYFQAPFSFGPYPDQKAGEQVYHHTLRSAVKAVLNSSEEWLQTGFASEFPAGRDQRFAKLLSLAEESLPNWRRLRQTAERIAQAHYGEGHYFNDSILTHVSFMCFSCEGYVHGLRGLLAWTREDFKDAFCEISQAKWAMQRAQDTLAKTEHGKWKHFYRGEWLTGTRETIRFLQTMQGLCRIKGDPGWKSKWIHEAVGLRKIPMNVIAQANADYDKLAGALIKSRRAKPEDDFTCLR